MALAPWTSNSAGRQPRQSVHGLTTPGVRNFHSLDSVDSTSIGRENPQRLKAILKFKRTATPGFRLSANVNQYSAINSFSDGFTVLVRDRPADSIDFITADLARGRPNKGRAETRREFGSLRGLDFHEAGEGRKLASMGILR